MDEIIHGINSVSWNLKQILSTRRVGWVDEWARSSMDGVNIHGWKTSTDGVQHMWPSLAFALYLSISASSRRRHCRNYDIWGFSPPEFIQAGSHLLDHFSAPTPTPFPLPLLFLLCLLLSKISVVAPLLFICYQITATYLLSAWACHLIPSFSSSLTSFLLSFLHLRHLVYKCSTDCSVSPHQQTALFLRTTSIRVTL